MDDMAAVFGKASVADVEAVGIGSHGVGLFACKFFFSESVERLD